MSTAAILLASGGGVRFGGATPKQFLDVLGRPVLSYTLDAFEAAALVTEIVVVCHCDWLEFVRSVVQSRGLRKVSTVIPGGETRQASSRAGLKELARHVGVDKVLIHDSVRPLTTPQVIDEAARRIDETGVVDVVAKATDTIVRSVEGLIQEIPERAYLYNGQTPQGFLLNVALEAHRRALEDGITNSTDDVQLALRLGYRPVIVDGGPQNIKITHPEDLEIVRLFLERKLGRSSVLRLTRPFVFEEVEVQRFPTGRKVSVRPQLGAICNADLRYYSGRRRPEALAQKLPMALLHEGVAKVVYSPLPELPADSRVVVVPNLLRCDAPTCATCSDPLIGSNYCAKNAFLSSGEDGLAQTLLDIDPENLLLVPLEVPTEIACMTEMLSIGVGALRRIDVSPRHRVVVVGNGPVGYGASIMAAELLQCEIPIIGRADRVPEADLYFEATGGTSSERAVNSIIDAALPGATIILLGVSEERIPLDLRTVLQKGLRLFGCSRSTREDCAQTLRLLRRPTLAARARKLLAQRRFSRADIVLAFEYALQKTEWGKVLIDLDSP